MQAIYKAEQKPYMNFTPTTQMSGGNIIHGGRTEIKLTFSTKVMPSGLPSQDLDTLKFYSNIEV